MPAVAEHPDARGASPPRYTRTQRLTLLACILGSSVAFLDGTIVNVALPAIRASLHGGLGTQEWVVDGYLLTLGSLLLIGGSLGDLFGRRRIFALGVGGFGIASLACALAPSAGALIAARTVQGIAAALLVPSNLALIMDRFSEHERAAAIGSWTAWTGIATVAGPLLGGLLVQAASWRWVFAVNIPIVLVTLWLATQIPESPRAVGQHLDWLGAMIGAAGLAGPIFALIEAPSHGWGDPEVLATLSAGCLLLIIFLIRERRCPAPMLPAAIFRSRNFSVGNLATFSLYAALNVVIFFLVVFLQQVDGYSPVAAGLATLPTSIFMFFLARRFGALADKFGPRLFMGVGPLITAVGLLLLLRIGTHPDYASDVLPGVVVLALGLAMTVAPLTATILSSVPAAHSGLASGINNAVARLAGLIAIAAVGAVVATHFSADVARGLARPHATPAYNAAARKASAATLQTHPPPGFTQAQQPYVRQTLESASVDTFHLAIVIAAILAVMAGILSLVGIRNPRAKPRSPDAPAQPS
ncbi:MAG TPA: MFS transporter [Solirubrobacteraceae bacterium]|jgi:EmrB/QacA subfamily drug resistance transporter|nr:MFS transporter [Solirubrobacteraceae bacterium]